MELYVKYPVMKELSVRNGLIYTPFDPRVSIVNPLIELTDNELRVPVVNAIDVAFNVLITIVLYVAESKYISPAMKELTFRVLIDANVVNREAVVCVLAITVLKLPVRLTVLFTFNELTFNELNDPTGENSVLANRLLNDPN